MMPNDSQPTAPAQRDPQTDPLNPLIASALAEQALPPLPPDFDLESIEHALTEDDRRALDSMGSPEDVAREALSLYHRHAVATMDSADAPTSSKSLSTTNPDPGSRFWSSGSAVDRDELMERMRSFECEEYVCWPSSYRKKKELGRGGQGVVYLAECLDEFHGEHALKIFSPGPYRDADSYHQDMDRMKHVASRVHRLQIDNLLDVERFVDRGGIRAMVMRWIDGFDLRQLTHPSMLELLRYYVNPQRWAELEDIVFSTQVERHRPLQPGYAVNIVEKILRALEALHSRGIVHRDIKPANIMLDCHGSIKLIDIGSAAEISRPPQHCNWTPLYAPPEFLEHRVWTEKSDLAALGYVLIELLSGKRSALGSTEDQSTTVTNQTRDRVLLEAKQELRDHLTEILPQPVRESAKLVRLCEKLIDPDPKNRFASASEAIQDGTFNFHKQLAHGNLVVHYALHIQGWLTDVKQANQQLR